MADTAIKMSYILCMLMLCAKNEIPWLLILEKTNAGR
jgi:hypothetical protein